MVWKILKVLFVLGAINGEANRSPIIRNLRAITNLIKVVQGLPNVQKGVLGLQDHLKQAARIGVMLGAAKVEKAMELNLIKLIDDFQRSLHRSNLTGARKKYKEIEAAMNRDKHAIEILLHAMALATTTENVREYREAVNKVAAKDSIERNQKVETKPPNQFDDVKASVDNHLKVMHCKVDAAMKQTIMSMYIKTKKKTSSSSSVSTSPTVTLSDNHMNDIYNRDTVRLPPLYVQMPVWLPGYNIYSYRRQNDDKDDERDDNDNDIDKPKENSEEIREEEFDDDLGSSGNGGIGGLIASLSGGDGGSDVGALVGAISGVITNLFGPGGLDIPLLISTGSSLIAGLLAGDENFGKVLGNYIGLAVEGFSGGGGAVSNGEFFGDFIGSLFSSLSADPEEKEGPKPKIFFDNFFKGFEKSKQKRGVDDEASNPKGYFFEFISNIFSSLVGGITNLILNSSLGSSGGSSQGSGDLSAGSSQGSHTGSAAASMGSVHSDPKVQPKK